MSMFRPYYFGHMISRNLVEELLSALTFGPDPDTATVDIPGVEREKWKCVEPFLRAFNRHREQTLHPFHELCVDESMSLWYELGGAWSRVRFSHILTLNRKPELGM